MKTLLILSILGLLVGCRPEPLEQTQSATISSASTGDISEFEYKGHRYLVYAHGDSSLIHAEHCPCKAPWATNVALNNMIMGTMTAPPTNAISP